MGDMASGGLYGIVALVMGGGVSLGVAWISRPRQDAEPDLATIGGLAEAIAADRRRIDSLEKQQQQDRRLVSALRRYVAALQAALRHAGVPVPDPAPEDEPLIRM